MFACYKFKDKSGIKENFFIYVQDVEDSWLSKIFF
jgi:hypothetical protein